MFNLYYNISNSTEEQDLIQSSFQLLEGLPCWSGIWSVLNGNCGSGHWQLQISAGFKLCWRKWFCWWWRCHVVTLEINFPVCIFLMLLQTSALWKSSVGMSFSFRMYFITSPLHFSKCFLPFGNVTFLIKPSKSDNSFFPLSLGFVEMLGSARAKLFKTSSLSQQRATWLRDVDLWRITELGVAGTDDQHRSCSCVGLEQ